MKKYIILIIAMFVSPLLGKEKLPIIKDKNINSTLVSGLSIDRYKEELLLKKRKKEKYKIKASSSLNRYNIKNINDKEIKTAWVEGKKDYGIGEYFEISSTDRVPTYILNGYHKSKKTWKENSRVKSFKVIIDNNKYFFLQLKDSMELQKFDLPIKKNIKHSYKFIILDIYKGTKYKDTAISDISHYVVITTPSPTIKNTLNNKKYNGNIIYRYFNNKKMSKNIFKKENLIKTVQYYKNGNKKSILNYSKCSIDTTFCSEIYCDLNGEFIQYYKNGKIQFKAYFKNDKLDGNFIYFTPTGKRLIETKFKNGVISKIFYYDKFKNKKETKFKNKKPIEGFFIKIKKISEALEFNDYFIGLGIFLSYYKDGELEKRTIFYPNGNKASEENYKYGKLFGKNIKYYKNGNKKSERDYTNKRYYKWDKNGNIYVESKFENDILHTPTITAQKNAKKYLEDIELKIKKEHACDDGDYSFNKLKSCKIQEVSSTLKSEKYNYGIESITDDNLNTAWIEGAKGYGIGESFTTKGYIINEIYNGYQKSKKTWKNNSRVKKLKIYIDGKFKFYLKLYDVMEPQFIKIPYIISNNLPSLTDKNIKYEIVEVYKGDKYQDTAISEVKTFRNPFDDSCD